MHILQIVIKNTSTIDFTLPLLWQLRARHPEARLSILFCVFDKRQILRRSSFYSRSFDEFNVRQYDFADFLKKPINRLAPMLRRLFSAAPADKIHLKEIYRKHQKDGSDWVFVRFISNLLHHYSLKTLVSSLTRNGLIWLEKKIGKYCIRLDRILPELAADLILYDNRTTTAFYGRDLFYDFFEQSQVPIALLPHGPHFRDPVSEFCAFDEKGHPLPDYCEFWMPLRFGTPWVCVPERRKQFAVVGYPGLDSEWLRYTRIRREDHEKHGLKQGTPGRKKILFIIRRYLPAGEKRAVDLDPFIIDHDDFIQPLRGIAKAIKTLDQETELVIKPHPVNNYQVLSEDLGKAGIRNWSITHDPIYAVLKDIDIVVSLFSTILLVPVLAEIPTIVVNSKLQKQVHEGWDLLAQLYTGLNFFVEDVNKLPETIAAVLKKLESEGIKAQCREDLEHLRYFFPDGATAKCLERITVLRAGYGAVDER